jgi:hypothetical protein
MNANASRHRADTIRHGYYFASRGATRRMRDTGAQVAHDALLEKGHLCFGFLP